MVLLKAHSYCFNSFISSWVEKVTNPLLQTFFSPVAEKIKQFSDHVKMRLSSQLINGILRVLHKVFKDFNGTAISAFLYYHCQVYSLLL